METTCVFNNAEINTDNDKARNYFWNICKLTYKDLTKENWKKLISILDKHLKERNELQLQKPQNQRDYIFEIDKCVFCRDTKHKNKCAYINVKLDNYSVRQGISFEPNEWIGFVGWASSYNTIPFTEAFMEWCDWVCEHKQQPVIIDYTRYTEFYDKIYRLVEPHVGGCLGLTNDGKFDLYLAVKELLDIYNEEGQDDKNNICNF